MSVKIFTAIIDIVGGTLLSTKSEDFPINARHSIISDTNLQQALT